MYQVSDFEYDLPNELIAQYPLPERTASRLLCLDKETGHIVHRRFADIISLLKPNDILVLNDTKVFPARFYGQKASGGKIECLFERVLPGQKVLAHVRASKAPKVGTQILLGEAEVAATVIERQEDLFLLQFPSTLDLFAFADEAGHLPLPGYIDRDAVVSDHERYQTVFAENVGAVAAPTAGLHFDAALLEKIREQGIDTVKLTLHVGAGTFQPVRVDKIEDHKMHREYIDVSSEACERILAAKAKGGRVIAVGTTVVRSLETAARNGQLKPFQGDTDIFIYPGFQFQCVDALVTNFHLPKSTLLMLVSAFAGYDNMQQAYRDAVNQQYRFFSYGDAMFIATSLEKMK